jgi:hypothetical protein
MRSKITKKIIVQEEKTKKSFIIENGNGLETGSGLVERKYRIADRRHCDAAWIWFVALFFPLFQSMLWYDAGGIPEEMTSDN